MHGEGFFDKLKNVFTNTTSPSTDDFVKKYGGWLIKDYGLHREPVQDILVKALDIISVGKFKSKVNKSYDQLYHLFLKFSIVKDGKTLYFTTEKLPNIVFTPTNGLQSKKQGTSIAYPANPKGTWLIDTFPRDLPVTLFIGAMQKILGPQWFKYDASSNNCQHYIKALLNGAGVHKWDDFILQDVSEILTGHTHKASLAVTNLGHFIGRLQGRQISDI